MYIDPPIPGINGEEMEMIPIRGQRTQCAINRIPDGTYRFGVQTFSSGNNYRSKIKWQAREINDLFKECLDKYNLRAGNIIRKPIDGLLKYHQENL